LPRGSASSLRTDVGDIQDEHHPWAVLERIPLVDLAFEIERRKD